MTLLEAARAANDETTRSSILRGFNKLQLRHWPHELALRAFNIATLDRVLWMMCE